MSGNGDVPTDKDALKRIFGKIADKKGNEAKQQKDARDHQKAIEKAKNDRKKGK